MSVAAPIAPPPPPSGPFRRLTVAEYHRLIQVGVLTDEDKVELLNGYMVLKMPRNPPHDASVMALHEALQSLCLPGRCVRVQCAITLATSEPEPDIVVARGSQRDYAAHHPGPSEIGLVVEISDTSLDRDRDDKGPIYAAAGLPEYWIVNLVDRQVEAYTQPTGTGYSRRQDFRPGAMIPLTLDRNVVGQIAVQDLLP
jgi:Uma2 family endonuclease